MQALTKSKHVLTANEAKVIGQCIWLCCVGIVAVTVGGLLVLASVAPSEVTNRDLDGLFWFSAALFTIGIPTAWYVHAQCFKRYWHHGVVEPRGYLYASVLMWGIFTVLILVIATDSLVRDGMFPDFLMLMPTAVLLLLTYPSGWAMTHKTTKDNIDDEHEIFHSSAEDL